MEETVASAPTSRDKLLEYLRAAFPSQDLPDIPENLTKDLSGPVNELLDPLVENFNTETLSAMLNAVSTPDFQNFNDTLVETANGILVAGVATEIRRNLKKKAGEEDTEACSGIVDVLFSCLFPDERDKRKNYASMENCVKDSMGTNGPHVGLVLKMLLRKCREKYVAVGLNEIVDLPQTKFLQRTFKSSYCLQALGSLLQSEVQEIRNVDGSKTNHDNFFRTTEIGSLLALSPLPDINRETMTLQRNDLMEILLQQYPDTNLRDKRPTISLNNNTVIPVVGDLLKHLLKSDNKKLCQFAINWMVSVLERNKIRCTLANPLSKEYEKACRDGYMLNFCQILLRIAQEQDFKLEEPFDISSYNDHLAHLNHLEQELLRGNTEEVKDYPWNLAVTVFILCQRAISVCLLPAIERMQCFLQVRAGRRGKTTDDPVAGEAMLAWYDEAVWGQALCDLVRNFAELQLEILHSLLQAGAKTEKDLFPDECVCNIASWYASYCIARKQRPALKEGTLDRFIEVCKFYLQFQNPSPRLAAHLVYALINFEDGNKEREIDQTLKPLLPVLVQCYINMSTMFRYPSARGVFQIHLARCDFVVLILRGLDDPDSLAVMQNCDFMEAVLETVVCLMASSISSDVSISQNKLARSDSRTEGGPSSEEKQITDPNEKCYLYALGIHLILLEKLTSQYSSSDTFQSHRAACAFRWMLNAFCTKRKPHWKIREKLIVLFIKCFLNIFRGATDAQDSFKVALLDQDNVEAAYLERLQEIVKRELQASEEEELAHLIEYFQDEVVSSKSEFEEVSLTLEGNDKTALDEDAQLASFQKAFTDCQFRTADLLPTHSFRHVLQDYSAMSAATKQHLAHQFNEFPIAFPHDLDSIKFLVRDKTRKDVLQCLITGPVGTPYSRGLFIFDIYCPPQYPEEPPLVKFLTTGGGTALFNPRLQRDGNVCLSILGTSANEDETGRWHGNGYSFLNILEEIFNIMRDDAKDEGRVGEIRELTVRHALLEPLRKAPKNFEHIVQEYFVLSHKALLQQMARWGKEEEKHLEAYGYSVIRLGMQIFVRTLNEKKNDMKSHDMPQKA